MESLTFPGSSFDLGTFRKHLFRDKLCRIEFWNKNKSCCELAITIFYKDIHVPHIYNFFFINYGAADWMVLAISKLYYPVISLKRKALFIKWYKKNIHQYWRYINKINNTLPYWMTQRLNLIIAAGTYIRPLLQQCYFNVIFTGPWDSMTFTCYDSTLQHSSFNLSCKCLHRHKW